MRPLLALALLAAPLLLAGCTQVDAAKQQLDDARRELDELRSRYERVRSLTIVREESLDLVLTPRLDDDGALRFDVNASRGGAAIPRANLTSLAPIALRVGDGPWLSCDPLTCAVAMEPGVEVTAQAAPASGEPCVVRLGEEPACVVRVDGARAWVTTAVSDATS